MSDGGWPPGGAAYFAEVRIVMISCLNDRLKAVPDLLEWTMIFKFFGILRHLIWRSPAA